MLAANCRQRRRPDLTQRETLLLRCITTNRVRGTMSENQCNQLHAPFGSILPSARPRPVDGTSNRPAPACRHPSAGETR